MNPVTRISRMKYKILRNGSHILRLEKNEEIIETLTKYCLQNNIRSGSITGIGGTDNITLKYYDIEKKDYLSKTYSGKNYEILSLNGNISFVDDKPFLHIHTTIGDSDYKVYGGHLGSAVIGITCEIVKHASDDTIGRKPDESFRLKFLNLN